jgi:hypothetical protein
MTSVVVYAPYALVDLDKELISVDSLDAVEPNIAKIYNNEKQTLNVFFLIESS